MPNEINPKLQLLVLERVDPARSMNRYYVLSVTPSLFGDTALVREWGRKGQGGQQRIELHAKQAGAGEALQAWLRRKVQRGYAIVHQR